MWDPWVRSVGQVGEIPCRWERLPTPVFWPGEFHGLSMDSPWGRKKSHTTERLSLHFTSCSSTPTWIMYFSWPFILPTILLSVSKRSFSTFNEDLLACTEEVRANTLKYIYLFIYLAVPVLVLARRLCSCGARLPYSVESQFPHQGLNLCLPCWKAKSWPLDCQESPCCAFSNWGCLVFI